MAGSGDRCYTFTYSQEVFIIFMSTRHLLVPRLVAVAALAAGMLAFAPAVGAQTCAYNSTQSTCACPTSGAGTSCFGGQLFKLSDNSCQNDLRPCSANQNWDCLTESCTCNVASYPCGGCTAASSTVGASCSAPANGKYTNVCGACACPIGTTLCPSSNTCVTTLVCPAGTSFDPCTNSCGTPNVLLSPGWVQSGYIQVNGDVKSTGGNLRMDSATGAGQGDTYIANGKAIRVDGAGVTSLSIGNWGVGGSSVNVFENGNHFAFGMSTIPGDTSVPANTIESGNVCIGNGINCRSSWPGTADFDPVYVNVTGDTMTGDLTLSGATADLSVGGKIGVGTAAPANKLDVGGSAVIGASFAGVTAAPANGLLVQGATAIGPGALSYSGHLLDVTAAGPITTPFVSFRDNAAGVELDFSRSGIKALGSNFVLDTDSGDVDINTAGTSKLFIQRTLSGGNVGVGTTSPAAKLDVNGTAKVLGFLFPTGAAAGRFLVSDASGNASWSAASVVSGSGTANYVPKFTAASALGNSQIFDNGTGVGIGTVSPAAGVKLDVNGAVKGSTFTNTASPIITGNLLIQPSAGTAAMVVGTTNTTQFFQVQNNLGQAALNVDTTNMRVGVGTAAPNAALEVNGGALFSGSTGGIPFTGAGTRFMWYPGKAALRAGVIMSGRTEWDDVNVGSTSVAFGLNSQASGVYSFSNGNNTHSTGDSSTTFGLSTFATNTGAFAAGNGNTASGYSSVALGNNTIASGTHTLAYGSGNQATGDYSTAGGLNSVASGNGTIAIGWGAHAAGGVGLGDNVYATGSDSVALGFASQATNTSATVSGYQSTGSGFASTAMGYNNTASGYAATAFGQSATAAGDRSVSMGMQNTANGPGSVALGAYNSTGTTGYATAVGYANSASGQYSFAGGYAATASGDMSFAYGQSPTASGYSSVALGQYNTASGIYSASYGNFLKTTGYKAISIGNGYDGTAGGLLTNGVGYSIMFGSHSNLPTMTIVNSAPGIGTIGNVGIGTTTPSERLEVNGNLKFTTSNPYISAASYFVAPGGAYFNSGTVYTEAAIQARGGIHNDTGSTLVLQGGTSGVTSTTGPLQVNAGSGGYGAQVNGTAGTWGPSVGVNNGTQEWRAVSWSDNSLKFVKITGSTFTPFTIYNNSYQDELELKSDGISLSGKHAFRSSDSWLRLNQDGAFTSGVHTPGNFAPGALNVGGANGWGNPGGGNAWIAGSATVYGDLVAESNSWGSGNGWIYCPANGQCWCPGGMFVIAELNYNYYYGYSYIYCAKP